MKFRKNSTHEFCVTNVLGLEADCLHKVPLSVLFAFCQKTHSIRNFSIAVHSQPFEIFVLFLAVQNNSSAVQMKFDLLHVAHLVA